MTNYRKELAELAAYFEGNDKEHILRTIVHGSDEEIEALVHECDSKLEGRSNEML